MLYHGVLIIVTNGVVVTHFATISSERANLQPPWELKLSCSSVDWKLRNTQGEMYGKKKNK